MVGEPRGTHEQAGRLAPAADNQTEVLLAQRHLQLLLWRDHHLNASQILDGLVALDEAAGRDAGLVRDDRVAVCRVDLEGAVGEVDGHVAAEVRFEVILFSGGLERVGESLESVGRKQFLFGRRKVGIDN